MNPEQHARIREIFLEATRLEEDQRESFLDKACGGDESIKSEVASLLSHHKPVTILAETPALIPAGGETDRQARDTLPAQISRGRSDSIWSPRTLGKTRGLSRRPLPWIALLLALMGLIGYAVYFRVRQELREMRADTLRALLQANVELLGVWIKGEESKVCSWASGSTLARQIEPLLEPENSSAAAAVGRESVEDEIRRTLAGFADCDAHFAVWDLKRRCVARWPNDDRVSIGGPSISEETSLKQALDGETGLTFLFPNRGDRASRPAGASLQLGVMTPLRGPDEKPVAAIHIWNIGIDEKFKQLFHSARTGSTGETYAFDGRGVMLTESRFSAQLADAGLLPAEEGPSAAGRLVIREPGGDVTRGRRPAGNLAAQPLTKMVRSATAGQDGDDLIGYPDYRGVRVIGAWDWIDEEKIGVASEVDYQEAYAALQYFGRAFALVLSLLALTTVGVAISSYRLARLQKRLGQSRWLGPYELLQKIGEGGMGQVYVAQHGMLKRPTAIKLIRPELVNPQSLARFSREVQLVSQLTHPNTIEIYDYGQTDDGVFYFAMEYLAGLDLAELVMLERELPCSRTIAILRQVCLSLREAHGRGLVHRDIKPQNIMVCTRGGDFDVVKVLDFGLVKSVDHSESMEISGSRELSGTPLFIAPERLTDPACLDVRSDIYSLGAVAFKCLTGRDAYEGTSYLDVLYKMLHTAPEAPSRMAKSLLPKDLDQLVLACMARRPEDRPQNVQEVLRRLDVLAAASPWTQADARQWWQENTRRVAEMKIANDPTVR